MNLHAAIVLVCSVEFTNYNTLPHKLSCITLLKLASRQYAFFRVGHPWCHTSVEIGWWTFRISECNSCCVSKPSNFVLVQVFLSSELLQTYIYIFFALLYRAIAGSRGRRARFERWNSRSAGGWTLLNGYLQSCRWSPKCHQSESSCLHSRSSRTELTGAWM